MKDFLESLNLDSMPEEYSEALKEGMGLATGRWIELTGDLLQNNDYKNAVGVALLCENTLKQMVSAGQLPRKTLDRRMIGEATELADVGTWEKFVFPIIRAVLPNLIANELVSVQPMSGPVGLVFYLDFIYGTSKGSQTAGTKMFENLDRNYGSEVVSDETLATGDNAQVDFAGSLLFTPIKPGSITISYTEATVVTFTDDGNGGWTGTNVTSGTINYQTGAFEFICAAAPDNATDITATYDYDMEMNTQLPEVELQLRSSPVTAIVRKLKARWGLEAAMDLTNLHSIDAEAELTAAIAAQIRYEIDADIINAIRSSSTNGYDTYSLERFDFALTTTTNIPRKDHYAGFYTTLLQYSSYIHRISGRAHGTWVILSENLAPFIESMPNFTPAVAGVGARPQAWGPYKLGTVGRFNVYVDPSFTSHRFLMGYLGASFLEAGYVYAPYIPLYAVGPITLDDFMVRKGMSSRYGKKLINTKFYLEGTTIAN